MSCHLPSPRSSEPEQDAPIPNTPTDVALLIVALRRLIVAWRERASAAAERESSIYRQAEADLTTAIATHVDRQILWSAIQRDLIRGLLEALDERDRST